MITSFIIYYWRGESSHFYLIPARVAFMVPSETTIPALRSRSMLAAAVILRSGMFEAENFGKIAAMGEVTCQLQS